MNKMYLGDGVYLTYDGYLWVLTAENGVEVTERIYLEPEVLANLIACIKRCLNVSEL